MNMELWAATFFAFCRITSFLYFLPFFSGRSIPAMAKVTFGLALSITVADQVDVSHIKTTWDVAALCWYANCNWIITFKNCRNAVEHSKNGSVYFRL